MISKNSCCAGSFNGDTETLTWPMSSFSMRELILSFHERTSCLQQAKTVLRGEISYSKFPFLSCRSRTRESVALPRLHHTLPCMQAASTSDITFRMLRGLYPNTFRIGRDLKERGEGQSHLHTRRGVQVPSQVFANQATLAYSHHLHALTLLFSRQWLK